MSKQNQSSFLRTLAATVVAFGSAVVLLLPVSPVVTQGRVVTIARSEKSAKSARPTPSAKLAASDSPEGSRVALTFAKSLKHCDAFRHGDRLFLKIPLAFVPKVAGLRARAFSDIKVERAADATLLIFHLRPGVTARVKQRDNKLEIVFSVSRSRVTTASPVATAAFRRNNLATSPRIDSKRSGIPSAIRTKDTAAVSKLSNSVSRPVRDSEARTSEIVLPAIPVTAAQTSDNTVGSGVAERGNVSPSAASNTTTGRQTNTSSNLVQRVPHWILVAQLNPVPLGVATSVLLLFLGFVLLWKRGGRRNLGADGLVQDDLQEALVKDCGAYPANLSQPEDSVTAQIENKATRSANEVAGESNLFDKLVLDNAHRADVMDARSPEDRKAIEASLINLVTGADIKAEDRQRARVALEEYGFVARHCATLLTGEDSWERAAAARKLGQIGSRNSLPFLIEALHDHDAMVRNEVVASLASLKDPAAIGALLAAARTHPDVPALLLSETLSACSVETLGPLDSPSAETTLLSVTAAPVEVEEAHLFEELSATDDDDGVLSGWLEQLDSPDETLVPMAGLPPTFTESRERPYLTLVA